MKNKIKAISFDLWGTLIKSNGEYKKQRAQYISTFCDLSVDEIITIIDNIKKDIDEGVEKFGFHYTTVDVYKMIHQQCNVQGLTVAQLYENCSKMFILNPPTLFTGVKDMLKQLNERGYKLYLSSNSLLIDGQYLSAVLEQFGILQYFTKTLFSNELGLSKPNPEFFKYLHMCTSVLKHEIIHVGDNMTTDIDGAKNYGMNSHFLLKNETAVHFFNDFINDKIKYDFPLRISTGIPLMDLFMEAGIPADKITAMYGNASIEQANRTFDRTGNKKENETI